LFDKKELKIYVIWPISFLLSFFLKYIGNQFTEPILINNWALLGLVFGPAFIVTLMLVLSRLAKI
tara:strand:- start:1232 stop:1426 length:195 start_codon:yes stop_codon:yes gene_type:complete